MKSKMKRFSLAVLAVLMTFTFNQGLVIANGHGVEGVWPAVEIPSWRDNGISQRHGGIGHLTWRVALGGNTYVRNTPNGANIGSVRQGAGFAWNPFYHGPTVVGNWTWIPGGLSGTAAQLNGVPGGNSRHWVSTSQLGFADDFRQNELCNMATGSSVRHAPGGPNQGVTGGSGAQFLPFRGGSNVNAGGWTWRLGIIMGTSAGTNGWNNRLVWIATSQLSGPTCWV